MKKLVLMLVMLTVATMANAADVYVKDDGELKITSSNVVETKYSLADLYNLQANKMEEIDRTAARKIILEAELVDIKDLIKKAGELGITE